LTEHNADMNVGMTWGAGHPRSSPTAAVVVIVGLNREAVSGHSTDRTMQSCVMLLWVLNGTVMQWHPVADWLSIGVFQVASGDRPCDNYHPVNSVWAVEQWTR